MIDTHKNDLKWSQSNKKKLDKLEAVLRKKGENDQIINRLHDQVFSDIDCLTCGNCCRTTGPLLRVRDVERLSKRLKIAENRFILQYTRTDEDGDLVFKSMPCPFLSESNHCSVYEDRPKACRDFPHTDQKGQMNIFHLTRKNARICPGVSKIMQELSKKMG